MESWEVEFAKKMKSKPKPAEVVIFGKVVQTTPTIKIMIFDGAATITPDDMIYTQTARSRSLQMNTQLVLIPMMDMSQFVFVDTKG